MEKRGVRPNTITYNALIDGYGKKGKMTKAHKLRDVMEAMGNISDAYTYASLIHGELSSGESAEELKLFSEMKQRNEALRLYDEMVVVGVKLLTAGYILQ
ncbi:hypothetical protein EZV62_022555 [Acer yangbiense]|uniref:Pentacotripeptide-repeat region of PRORP domain-containing protein n=1 Tax=Acer yangbiense TaxID=1000413 RepID=A0A5C7HB66_9ROSI|nr:hypothetical protein EZV62_022555 [Acer yangbiense]